MQCAYKQKVATRLAMLLILGWFTAEIGSIRANDLTTAGGGARFLSGPSSIHGSVVDESEAARGFCGTEIPPEQIEYELSRTERAPAEFRLPTVTYHVPVTFHVVRRSDGSGGLPVDRLHMALSELNEWFTQVSIQFFRFRDGDNYVVDYIDDDNYFYNTNTSTMRNSLRTVNRVINSINIYFVPSLREAGISSLPFSSYQGILINNRYPGNPGWGQLMAHEMGHYLGLYHTFETSFGVECPDGSNCGWAGDRMCDTPADPNMNHDQTVDRVYCSYFGDTSPPPGCSGEYDPPVHNLMSYSNIWCQNEFTPEQIAELRYTLTSLRSHLFQFDSTDGDGDGILDVIDVCPQNQNADQIDSDGDFLGDPCDNYPNDIRNDLDADGLSEEIDNCPRLYNPDQVDLDSNGVGDLCQCIDGKYRLPGPDHGDNFGWRINSAGDMNGDGYEDFIVGGYAWEFYQTKPGMVQIFSGADLSLLYTIDGDAVGGMFGSSVGPAGDVNEDGYDDVLVGADNYASGAGRAYLFLGSDGPFPVTLGAGDAYRVFDGTVGDGLGSAVTSIADLDDDGMADHALGAWAYTPMTVPTGGPGKVEVYSGRTGSLIRTYTGETSGDAFGYALADLGDVNDDMFSDFAIGAPFAGGTGKVYVYSGSSGELLYTFVGQSSSDAFGAAVSSAGDADADGYADIAVGAPWCSQAGSMAGRLYIYSGHNGSVIHTFDGPWPVDQLGFSVSGLGDINGDVHDDVAVGCRFSEFPIYSSGAVYVVSGQDGSLLTSIIGEPGGIEFGRGTHGGIDLNNDGTGDLIVGAPAYGSSFTSFDGRGQVYVYLMGDLDEDNLHVGCDNCVEYPNPGQLDSDYDGLGDACESCCVGLTGNIDGDPSDVCDIGDLTTLIDFLFISYDEPECMEEANINGDEGGVVDIGDLTKLIDFLFITYDPPAPCEFLTARPRVISHTSSVELGVDFDGRTTTLWLSSEQELRGLQLVLASESQTPEKTIADGLDMYYGRGESYLHLGIFDSDGPVAIPTGISPILEFEGRVDVVEAVVSDLNHRSWTPRVASAANSNLPKQYSLAQNYPNPFNPTTEIRFSLPQAADVRLQVFNVAGRLVATLVDGNLSAGHHTVTWHASEAASGVYFYRLQAGDYVASRKMMLLK